MPDKVIDASALAALAFDEDAAADVRGKIRGYRLLAPTLIEFELANAAWKRARRFPDRLDDLVDALEIVSHLPLRFRGTDRREVIRIAVQTGLTVYDASYLWLARQLGIPLVTLDKKLAAYAEAL
jgi:predicted nucleic acid-binding protein